jgi:hypothetical protein
MLRIGLLSFVAADTVPQGLSVSVDTDAQAVRPAPGSDGWNNWVFSVRGSGSFEGEESQREVQTNVSVSADRITPDWKITMGSGRGSTGPWAPKATSSRRRSRRRSWH